MIFTYDVAGVWLQFYFVLNMYTGSWCVWISPIPCAPSRCVGVRDIFLGREEHSTDSDSTVRLARAVAFITQSKAFNGTWI